MTTTQTQHRVMAALEEVTGVSGVAMTHGNHWTGRVDDTRWAKVSAAPSQEKNLTYEASMWRHLHPEYAHEVSVQVTSDDCVVLILPHLGNAPATAPDTANTLALARAVHAVDVPEWARTSDGIILATRKRAHRRRREAATYASDPAAREATRMLGAREEAMIAQIDAKALSPGLYPVLTHTGIHTRNIVTDETGAHHLLDLGGVCAGPAEVDWAAMFYHDCLAGGDGQAVLDQVVNASAFVAALHLAVVDDISYTWWRMCRWGQIVEDTTACLGALAQHYESSQSITAHAQSLLAS